MVLVWAAGKIVWSRSHHGPCERALEMRFFTIRRYINRPCFLYFAFYRFVYTVSKNCANLFLSGLLPSFCQKLSKLVKIWQSSDKTILQSFFETRCSYSMLKWGGTGGCFMQFKQFISAYYTTGISCKRPARLCTMIFTYTIIAQSPVRAHISDSLWGLAPPVCSPQNSKMRSPLTVWLNVCKRT